MLTLESVNSFSDEIYKVSRSKYNWRGEERYLIVAVIILFLSDAPVRPVPGVGQD